MSASWQPPGSPRCRQRTCARAGRFAEVSAAAAWVSAACVVLTPYRLLFGAALLLSATAAVAAAGYQCPHSGGDDLEALMDAIREPRQDARVLYLDRFRRKRQVRS